MNGKVLLVLALVLCVTAQQVAGQNLLNQALSASLNVLIVSGQYAQIYNKWLGVGTFIVPTACGGAGFPVSQPYSSLQRVLDSKQIIFGAQAQNFPFTFAADADNYIRVGANYDLAVAIGSILSLQYNTVVVAKVKSAIAPNGFSDLSRDVQLGVYDAVLDLIVDTSARENAVDFTCPYFTLSLGILESSTLASPAQTYNDLNSNNYSIGFVQNTLGQNFVINNLPGVTFNNKIPYTSSSSLWAAATGANPVINVAIDFKPNIQYFASTNLQANAFVPNNNLYNPQPVAIFTPKGSAGRIACATVLALVLTALATLL